MKDDDLVIGEVRLPPQRISDWVETAKKWEGRREGEVVISLSINEMIGTGWFTKGDC